MASFNELEMDTHQDEHTKSKECDSSSQFTTKLERRRRIEEINEEKRLREELDYF